MDSPGGIFPDEIWLKILCFSDLRSKGRMACASTTLYRIVQDDILWKRVDLTRNQASDVIVLRDERPGNILPPTWYFPPSETQVLKLAQTYFGARLQELHLHVVNTEILKFLQDNCPVLESIRFPHSQMSLRSVDLTFMPRNLKKLDLCLKGCFIRYGAQNHICQFGVQPLDTLEVLTIRYTEFSPELFERLRKFHRLQQLVLHQCSVLTLHGFNMIAAGVPELRSLWFRYCVVRISDIWEFDSIVRACTDKLRNLKELKVQMLSTKNFIGQPLEFDIFGSGLHTDFQSLWLDNVNLLSPEMGLKSLKDSKLQELELVNCDSVDNDVVVCICQNLQHLKRLNLKGCKHITDNGMSSMNSLRFLEYLNIYDCKLTYKCICDTVVAMESLHTLHMKMVVSQGFCMCVAVLNERCPLLKIYDQHGLVESPLNLQKSPNT